MSLSISEFKFGFDKYSFIEFWTNIQSMLNKSYNNYDYMQSLLEHFNNEFEKIKNKNLMELQTIDIESLVLRDSIWKILKTFYQKTPLEIFVEFFKNIRDYCFQGGYGHHIDISRPNIDFLTPDEQIQYCEFFKVILSNKKINIDSFPHHYVLHHNAFYKVENINIEVYFALLALNCYMVISKEADNEIWGN
jgi:hypothetical protein